jgi:flagellar biosynthesis/type III secretory pathway protein FliH
MTTQQAVEKTKEKIRKIVTGGATNPDRVNEVFFTKKGIEAVVDKLSSLIDEERLKEYKKGVKMGKEEGRSWGYIDGFSEGQKKFKKQLSVSQEK